MIVSQPTCSATERFVSALRRLERYRDVEPLLRCFSPRAELSQLGREPERGNAGARHFWERYRGAFGDLESHFVRFNDGHPVKILEWRSQGTLPNGAPFSCSGVTLLEIDGDEIVRFRTYFDSSAVLVRSESTRGSTYSKAV